MKFLRKIIFISFICAIFAISALAESSGDFYVNEEYGFSIAGPIGWIKEVVAPGAKKSRRGGVSYRKNAEDTFPVLEATIDVSPEDITNAVDFSRLILQEWKKALDENKSGTLEVIEEPREIEVNGIKGSRAIFDLIATDGKIMRQLDYKFMKNNEVISIIGIDRSATFDANIKDFEIAIGSFNFK